MMMGDVVNFKPNNAAIDPDVVLQEAVGNYDSVFVIGWGKKGVLDARASLNLGHADIHWLISVFQKKLLDGDYSAEEDI